jgi:mRNA interferase MazF
MGREQSGPRYAVVVQSDDLFLSTLIVVPTSTSAIAMDHRPQVTIEGRITQVLAEQVMTVDPARLGDRVDRLTFGEMTAVNDALRLTLQLD